MNPVAWFDALSSFVTSVIFFSVTIGGVTVPLIVVWLIVAGGFFTVYLGFQNIRGFKHALQLVSGKYDNDPDEAGEVSHFQALATAVSGTVGLGNIAGVAVAISLGGPGATFWMIVAGFLGMSTKMAECTLGVKYRHQHSDGSVSGGPMYYLREAVGKVTNMRFGKFLAGFFAVCCVGGSLGGGNMFQSNQATQQIVNVTGGAETFVGRNPWVIGLIFAVLVAVVIIGGIKSIARVTEKIVPGMAIIYVAACLFVLVVNFTAIPGAIGQIFAGAFTGAGITGGVIGVLLVGFQRAAFSNEAGIGSASIAHSAVRTNEPATEGYVALLEPFIDTIVICTMTALTIVITGVYARPDATELGGVGPDVVGLRLGHLLVPDRAGDLGDLLRLLHHDQLELLRDEGDRLPVRRQPEGREHLQGRLLRVHGDRLGRVTELGDRLLRLDDLRDVAAEHHRSLHPGQSLAQGDLQLPGPGGVG